MMTEEKIDLLTQRLPRYTSYPTAPHFKAIDKLRLLSTWQEELDETKPVSLYLHIPFCAEMCWYCGCHTKITKKHEPVESYVSALISEIEQTAQRLSTKRTVSHIHFGGGSPTLLEPAEFERIMDALGAAFTLLDNAEIAIEMDPRTLTEEKIKSYAEKGVNRASLGVQDIHNHIMEAVGRPQTLQQTQDACRMLRAHGITNINFDVMYGFPHQTAKTMADTMHTLAELKPSRIAFFGYAHVPWMKKHMRLIPEDSLPDTDARMLLMKTGRNALIEQGYIPVGIDHYAMPEDDMVKALKKGRLKRNFQGYTTDTSETLIGFGASSISKYPGGFMQNQPNIGLYKNTIGSIEPATVKYCPTTRDDHDRGDIIEALMCNFEAYIPEEYDAEKDAIMEKLGNDILEWDSLTRTLCIIKEGYLWARVVASAFDAYLKPSPEKKHSAAI
jgi:oxygen-independent coproporphyrinogen-3 oxidase